MSNRRNTRQEKKAERTSDSFQNFINHTGRGTGNQSDGGKCGSDLVDDMGSNFGKPRFYDTITDSGGMPRLHIHYSRVIRIEGVELPYWQRISENLWGQSVVERMWDSLLAYDSATAGIGQMVYKAHLRTLSVEGLREIIGGTTAAMRGLIANIDMIRVMQTNEGLTLLDTRDKFETHQPFWTRRAHWFIVSFMSNLVVTISPDVMSGAPVFPGTRVPVHTLLEYLEAGDSIDEFLAGFPSVTRSQVVAFLERATTLAVTDAA